MNVYEFHRGTTPLLISIPHSGTELPDAIAHRFTVVGRGVPDTDWHVHQLYDFARGLGASIIKANYSRYVVDLNRSSDSAPLYVGSPTSPVCPTETFGGSFIYMAGHEPDEREIAARIDQYWRPYHERIATGARGVAREARQSAVVGCAFDRERDSELVRRSAAGIQHWHP